MSNEHQQLTTKDIIQQEVEKLILSTKNKVSELKVVAVGEAWKILQLATATVIQIIEAIGNDLASPEKKKLAMELLDKFYDMVFKQISIPMVPNFVSAWMHNYIKAFIMVLVSSTIDALVTTFRSTGVFLSRNKEGLTT
jgi:hypothetical protein